MLYLRNAAVTYLAVHLLACGDGGGAAKPSDPPAPGEGIDYTFESLDVSSLDVQSESWCTPPAFEPAGYTGLDRATFADVLADYTSGWMAPLHESLLGLNEVDLFDSLFETILASYSTGCDGIENADLETLPPPEGELLDPVEQQAVRDDVREIILDAEVISEGEAVRLVVRDCEDCAEGLAQYPLFVIARMTTDGVLVVDVELGEGNIWVRKLIITPDAVVVQAPLGQGTVWQADVAAATPDFDEVIPDIQGMATAVIRKNNAGGTSATLGVSSLSFDAQPGQTQTVWGEAQGDCIGFHLAISGSTGEAQAAAELGSFQLTIPGAVNCDVAECGEQERQGSWVYSLGGISATAKQPGPSEPDNLHIDVRAKSASTARLGSSEFARGGIGKLGEGGHLGLSVDKTPAGFWVTFDPKLNLGGAMTITTFSDQLRMNLPEWLQNEIFDVTFGGDPKAQIFVPARAPCSLVSSEDDPPEPARRDVEITQGTLQVTRASDELTAGPGTCVGKTSRFEDTLALTSDWVDVGYSCP